MHAIIKSKHFKYNGPKNDKLDRKYIEIIFLDKIIISVFFNGNHKMGAKICANYIHKFMRKKFTNILIVNC